MKTILTFPVICIFSVGAMFSQNESGIVPRLAKEDILIYEDITYSHVDGHELKLDIAVPRYLNSPAPVIFDLPGGAWRICNKSVDDALFYAEYGFIGVSVEYRTSDIAVFPAAVHDCKAAIRWLRANADKYSIDPEKIGISGISAGGHLAALLGTSGGDEYLEGTRDNLEYSSRVQAVADHFGPVDFLSRKDTAGLGLLDFNDFPDDESPEALFLGGPVKDNKNLARLANPVNYIDPEDPPILIGHGEKDGMVIIRQSELLYDALIEAGIPTRFLRVKNAGHQYRPYKWDATVSPSTAEIIVITIQWFQQWLGKPDLDSEMMQKVNSERDTNNATNEYSIYYKITIDLPGKTPDSYCIGRFKVICEGKDLAEGEISMKDLSTEDNRTYQKDFLITGINLQNKELMWNFRGEVFDSKLNEKYGPMYMQGVKFDDSITGIGYSFRINPDKSFEIDKEVYRK